jgi:DNA-binding transcriptional LysR family regulator
VLAEFKKLHPKVDVVVRCNANRLVEQMMLKAELELAVGSLTVRSADLVSEPCVPLKMVLFAAKSYPLARKQMSLAEAEKIPLIIRDDGHKHGTTETLLRSQGFRANIVIRCESHEAIKTAVSNKLGVGILYWEVVKEEIARGLFRQVHVSGVKLEANTYIV